MNILQLVFKQMRQRALSTWLTLVSVTLGVALAVAILILYREGSDLFVQKSYGFEVLIGPPKGSPLQLVLNTVYHIDQSAGNIPYSVYETLVKQPADVKIAIPIAVGDSFKNHRIVGTSPKLFGDFEYQIGKKYELVQGKVFESNRFEAVIGSDVPARTGLKLGEQFRATHGLPQPGQTPDEHETQWTVVGVLKPTHTAADRVIYIPLQSFFAISEHEEGLEQQAQLKKALETGKPPEPGRHDEDHKFEMKPDGTFELKLPKEDWQISAIMVKARGSFQAQRIMYHYKIIDPNAAAVNPAEVMREFFTTFLRSSTLILLLVSLLVIIVAAVGILVAIYNSVSARMREIAILRALGATRAKILTLICLEAGMIGLIGGLAGAVIGHMTAAAGSVYLNRILGQSIRWFSFDRYELACLIGVILIAVLAGLVPALKAYRVPVATNLVSG